jgi:hypothetical protein
MAFVLVRAVAFPCPLVLYMLTCYSYVSTCFKICFISYSTLMLSSITKKGEIVRNIAPRGMVSVINDNLDCVTNDIVT